MGLTKKNKTYTDADAQNIFNKDEYYAEQEKARKYAMHQYLADTSGKWAWEMDVDLVDYLLGSNDTRYAAGWDKAYRYSTTDKFSHTGESKNTDRDKYIGEYYPFIQLKDGTLNNKQGVTETQELCKILNLNHDDLINQFKQGYGEEWDNLHMCALGLAVELPDTMVIEKSSEKGKICYLYRYLENLINTRQTNACEVANRHIKYHNRFDSISKTELTETEFNNRLELSVGGYAYRMSVNVEEGSRSYTHCWKEDVGGERPRMVEKCETTYHRAQETTNYIEIYYKESSEKIHKITIKLNYQIAYWRNAWSNDTDQAHTKYYSSGWYASPNSASKTIPIRDLIHAWVVNHGFPMDADTETDLCLIPIDRKLISDYSAKEKSNFLRENLYVFHTWQKTVKVYRSWVKPFVKIGAIIVAVVIAIKSAGTGTKASIAILKAAASMAVGLAVDKLIDFAVKIGFISARTAAVIKIVVAAVTIASGAGWDFSKILTAPNIMKVINTSFQQYSKLQQKELQDITKQMNEHNTMHAKRVYDLEQKQKLYLDGFSNVASLYLHTPSFTPTVDLFETVEMMYARHRNYNVVGVSVGLIDHLSAGLYTGKPKLYQIQDSSEDLQDMLIIS